MSDSSEQIVRRVSCFFAARSACNVKVTLLFTRGSYCRQFLIASRGASSDILCIFSPWELWDELTTDIAYIFKIVQNIFSDIRYTKFWRFPWLLVIANGGRVVSPISYLIFKSDIWCYHLVLMPLTCLIAFLGITSICKYALPLRHSCSQKINWLIRIDR